MRPMLVLSAAALALSGCAMGNRPLADDFGAATRQNIAAQIADPDAVYARDEEPASSGRRAASAASRYERGQVIQPAAQGTSSLRVQRSGGGQGGAGGQGGQ